MVAKWLHGAPSGRRAGLSLLWLACVGCGDWPHFDYADGPVVQIPEQAEGDSDAVQYLHTLHDDVQITGRIETSGYTAYEDAPFNLEGWYSGDVDWFEFGVRDPEDASIQLSWSQAGTDLDLYLFTADSAGNLSLLSYEAGIDAGEVTLTLEGLTAGTVYVAAVAGRQGDAVDYTLFFQLTSPS